MVDAKRLQSFADRILSLKADEDEVKKDIRKVYEEAVEAEVDKTGLGQLVTYLRKREKNTTDFDAKEAVFLGYLALYNASLTRAHAYARARTGEIIEEIHADSNGTDAQPKPSGSAVRQPDHEPPSQQAAAEITGGDHANSGGKAVASHASGEPAREGGSLTPSVSGADDADDAVPSPGEARQINSPTGDAAEGTGGVTHPPLVSTHNPETHFLNSKGLPRLHGCTNPEACAGSHRKLCFECSTRHDGPAYQPGEQRESVH